MKSVYIQEESYNTVGVFGQTLSKILHGGGVKIKVGIVHFAFQDICKITNGDYAKLQICYQSPVMKNESV